MSKRPPTTTAGNARTGVVSTTQKGAGYIDDPDPKKDSIYIEPGFLNTALNGDTVEVVLKEKNIRGKKQTVGEVIEVVSRGKANYVGIVSSDAQGYYLVPDDRKMYVNVRIATDKSSKHLSETSLVIPANHSVIPAKAGIQSPAVAADSNKRSNVASSQTSNGDQFKVQKDDKVQVRLNPWTDPKVLPTGTVIKILGKKGNNDVEMEAIVLEKGFEVGFPVAVEKEAQAIEHGKAIGAAELALRRDMRQTLTFTIDPFDAKDFDDAISFRVLEDEGMASDRPASELASSAPASRMPSHPPKARSDATPSSSRSSSSSSPSGQLYEIGVHIADVSHYVRPGTALDAEAVKRGCSVYLVDRTIPMLPEALSNDVCSLNPHEDKLSFSAIFVMDDQARIHSRWFGRTVMNSTHRFTYETAQAVIEGNPEAAVKYSKGIQTASSVEAGMKYRDIMVKLNDIAKVLQKEKFSKGAIEFEQDEVKFRLDKDGRPIGVYVTERLDAHKLVEEYMLLANREVAKYIYDSIKRKGTRDTGAIYRIHDSPDKDKIKDLVAFVKALGYTLPHKDGVVTAHDINHLLDQIEDTPHESLIRTATIRSMQKAIYSTSNIGHFGLAFDFYTHFTSPIRRYPDLLVHRVLAMHLHDEPFGDRDIGTFQKIAESSTAREISASQAERESRKLKQVEYMSTRVGQIFKGTISGVTNWGMYVEDDESKSEGMIRIGSLGDDYYVFNAKTYSIIGDRTKKKFQLGDRVSFKVVSADLEKKMLEYELVKAK